MGAAVVRIVAVAFVSTVAVALVVGMTCFTVVAMSVVFVAFGMPVAIIINDNNIIAMVFFVAMVLCMALLLLLAMVFLVAMVPTAFVVTMIFPPFTMLFTFVLGDRLCVCSLGFVFGIQRKGRDPPESRGPRWPDRGIPSREQWSASCAYKDDGVQEGCEANRHGAWLPVRARTRRQGLLH